MSESFRPSSESAPVSKDIGSDSGSEKSEKKDTKKKSKSKARLLGGAAAEKVLEVPKEAKDNETLPKSESLWQKFVKEDTEKEPSTLLSTEKNTLSAKDTEEAPTVAQLETLSADEARETVRQYADARLEDVTASEQEQDSNRTVSAENAADAALLESIQQKLAEDPERPVADVLDAAEREVAETIQNQEVMDQPDRRPAYQREDGVEDLDHTQYEAEAARVLDDQEDTQQVAAAQSPPPEPPSGRRGFASGSVPPLGGETAFTRSTFINVTSPSVARAAEQQLHNTERAAAARGLVVGGIVGYLVGKRRGRIKTEKQLAPVQERLQKQVETLTTAVAEKEQRVRSMAAEKAAILQSQAEKQRFAEHLRPAPSAEIVSKSSTHERPKQPGALHVERLGKFVVETPAVLAGAAAGAAVAERSREKPVAVDFSKKAEAYSSQELKAASEKVRIDGVTLKEIQQTHNLDERAVRRVMKQYLEGGNVREALNQEIVETELKYERDPRLRAAQTGGQGSASGTAAVAGAAMLSLLGADKNDAAASAKNMRTNKSDKEPVPDQATLAKLRRQQATELAAVSITIIVFFAVLIVLVV